MYPESSQSVVSLHMKFVAGLCVLALIGVVGWQIYRYFWPQSALLPVGTQTRWISPDGEQAMRELAQALGAASIYATSSTPEEIAEIGTSTMSALVEAYTTLSEKGIYTPAVGERVAHMLASGVEARVPYTTIDASSVKTSTDVSYRGMITYRSALQKSLSPLQRNTTYELALYNEYMETQNPAILTEIKTAASRYLEAADRTTAVTAPVDAQRIHADVINALRQFGTTLYFVADNIGNPVTSLALLVSYSKAEDSMMNAFTALDAYYASKRP